MQTQATTATAAAGRAPQFRAVIFAHSFRDGRWTFPHLTSHRTQAAASRALSRAITATARNAGCFAVVVTPDRRVLSLRQAQGKMTGEASPAVAENALAALSGGEG